MMGNQGSSTTSSDEQVFSQSKKALVANSEGYANRIRIGKLTEQNEIITGKRNEEHAHD